MDSENREPEIKVTDRRRFSSDGEALDSTEEQEASPQAAESSKPAPEQIPLPPPTFEWLVLSFRWQVELQLGMYAGGEAKRPPDLEGAHHTIDLMSMLQEKTRGNLTLEEQRLLENSLTELRFRYVQAVDQYAKKN